ncbi:MAG: hypothetical protein Tsb008_15680 [Rhodothalassiaceae bacterium]
MSNDRNDRNDRNESGSRPERPVWSHKTGEGYLETFLAGPQRDEADASDDAAAAAGAPAERGMAGDDLHDRVIAALRQIYDPEIPVNIYDLGLIYDVRIDERNSVDVRMTLTTPHCPVAESMPHEVDMKLRAVEGVNDVDVDLVWDPPWDMSRMSDEARLELGLL